MTLNIYCQKLIQKKFPIPEKLYIHVHIYSMGTDGVNKYIVPKKFLFKTQACFAGTEGTEKTEDTEGRGGAANRLAFSVYRLERDGWGRFK